MTKKRKRGLPRLAPVLRYETLEVDVGARVVVWKGKRFPLDEGMNVLMIPVAAQFLES